MAVTPNSIITTQAVANAQAVTTAAKTTHSDATNAVLLFTAGANGGLLRAITARPRVTVTATQLNIYSSPDGGTTINLVKSALMAAYTLANTTAIPETDLGFDSASPRRLAPNEKIYVGAAVALAGGIAWDCEYESF